MNAIITLTFLYRPILKRQGTGYASRLLIRHTLINLTFINSSEVPDGMQLYLRLFILLYEYGELHCI